MTLLIGLNRRTSPGLGSTISLTQLADSPARSAFGSASAGLVNSSGSLVMSYSYQPFGTTTIRAGQRLNVF